MRGLLLARRIAVDRLARNEVPRQDAHLPQSPADHRRKPQRLAALLPWLKPALCAIASIYLLRGLLLVPVLIMPRTAATPFGLWSSAICLVFAAAHVLGLIQVRDRL